MSEVQRISDQLKRAYEGEAWHGPSLKEILAGVSADQAARRPVPTAHSIWEIVLHIAAWDGVVCDRLHGNYLSDPAEGDWPAAAETTDEAWAAALEALGANHLKLRKAIASLNEADLDKPLAPGKPSAYVTLHGVIQHDLYHGGQIALLKKE